MIKLLNDLPEAHLLTAAQEAALSKRGIIGRNKLVLHTMREAFVYARRCCRAGLPDDDIYSMCYRALQASAKRYNPKFGRFFAYAKVNIRGQLSREFKRLDVVKHSSRGEPADINTTKHVLLNGIVEDRGGEREGDVNIIPDFGSVDPEFDLIDIRERIALIEPILKTKLTPREQQVIELRYKSGFNFTKIGELFGASRQAMEMTHANALKKVRKELAKKISPTLDNL